MRIATWNVNGLRARQDFVLHWLQARQPDVVGLQELKLTDEQFPSDAFESLGYSILTHGQKAWNGVAILSRKPAELVQRGLPGQQDQGARLVTARVEDLSFTTMYCPNGKSTDHEDFPRKLAWFDALAGYLESLAADEGPTVVCGDFNICPAAIDSWDEERHRDRIFHTEAERERFQRLLELGFVDAFRERHPDAREFSWWDYRGGAFHRGLGLRIDFLLASRSAMERLRAVEIDRDYRKKKDGLTASDHAPVIADLD
jgi:exodeoxyribonuclease-3